MYFEAIRSFVAEQLGFEETWIEASTLFSEDLNAEASDIAELLLLLEQEYALEWTDDDLTRIKTVGDLAIFVEEQQ